jgi:caffeoyl-CoA O-methyltransferase
MAELSKSVHLRAELHRYVVEHSDPLDPVARSLVEATEALGGVAIMQVAPEQGLFLSMLMRLMGARRAIEVGTFTGYSALCIARGLGEGGQLLCCDISEEWTALGRRHWEEAGVADRIDLRIAPAAETLAALGPEPVWDFAFLDADKTGYATYYEEILPRLRPGGVIAVDNVIWFGRVIDASDDSEDTAAIRAFNDRVAADERVETVMLSISDGLTLLRKK